MKFTITKLNNRMSVVTSDTQVKRYDIVLDPVHHVNRVKQVWHKDKTVKFIDGCGTHLRSAKKIESIILDGVEIII